MTAVLTDLISDLKVLRKGRGLFVSRIDERVGTTLRTVCEVTDSDGPAEIRHKVGERLGNWAKKLPPDLRVAVMAAFAIAPDARLPLYQDRVNLAAEKLNRDPRTARRRIDDGIQHLAQLAAAFAPNQNSRSHGATRWHTAELRTTLALDRERPEVLEQRRIVADVDDLSEVDIMVTAAAALGVDMFHGGTLTPRGGRRGAYSLRLPDPLQLGQSHDVALRARLGREQHARPWFAVVLEHPCATLDLRVRFDRRRVPGRITAFEHVHPRDFASATDGVPVHADAAGEVQASFTDLTPGMAYGVRWDTRTGRAEDGTGVLAARTRTRGDQDG
ncbi:hypothetical protein [Actinophytocola algeriensis]|uniref:Uncharacterized protein n=1 Tax=Actinophytocola algeriensis TaxID=1768010 RepID=A0A7W7VCW4_9PSEU|nr:hypothetical protein [Actinophytocola algeriensis]MBB4905517.1 hypothetical protein [Actinophytocola algeriensis]MBE1472798.1 hypothetical protein [Actinophytocola algeriensis]